MGAPDRLPPSLTLYLCSERYVQKACTEIANKIIIHFACVGVMRYHTYIIEIA